MVRNLNNADMANIPTGHWMYSLCRQHPTTLFCVKFTLLFSPPLHRIQLILVQKSPFFSDIRPIAPADTSDELSAATGW